MFPNRLHIFGAFLGLLFLGLAGRLWWLQLARWSDYTAKAQGNRTAVVRKPAPRGLILDRAGRVLADNREVWAVGVIPSRLPKDAIALERDVIAFLASTLSTPEAPVSTAQVREAVLRARQQKALDAVPLVGVGEDLSFEQMAAIEERRLCLPGVVVNTGTRRNYPYGSLASGVLGYTRPISRQQLLEYRDLQFPLDPLDRPAVPEAALATVLLSDPVYSPDSTVGAQGVEALAEFDRSGAHPVPMLPGRPGRDVYEVDASGTPQRLIAQRDPVPGASVYLTLDAQVQYVAERALREAIGGRPDGMGAAVVMDVQTGEILALASHPCMDPNDWVSGLSPEQWKMALADKALPLLNKAIGGAYPPGSVFKVISVCAAMETAGVKPSSGAYCTGKIYIGRRREPFRCWAAHQGGHGAVNLYDAIARSCNIFFYDCVLEHGLDPDNLADYARRFGLGETTGLGLPGEVAGEVPAPKFSFSSTGQPWRLGNSLNFVIGQDRLTVTPLQMCVVCAAIASGGRLITPNLIKRVRWPAYMHRKDTVHILGSYRPLKVQPETLAVVRRGMRLAVTDPRGTAHLLNGLPFTSAGKTGSAQHRPGQPTHAWFICFAPYESPRYALCVFVAGGGAGGEVAAPVAARLLRVLFGEYDREDPCYALPAPMDAQTLARQRAERVAAAKAWLASRSAAPAKASGGSNTP